MNCAHSNTECKAGLRVYLNSFLYFKTTKKNPFYIFHLRRCEATEMILACVLQMDA